MIVELLQPAGPDLVRRLAAALLLVPRAEREAIVAAIERRIAETYPPPAPSRVPDPSTVTLVQPPRQRDGYVERVETTYDRPPHVPASTKPASKPSSRSRRA
jgi:hypothetical protein